MSGITKEKAIQTLVSVAIENYAEDFRSRHEGQVDNPNGVINMKVHNVFIEALGSDIQYYASLVRSFDSSLGYMIEKLAIRIASLSFEVRTNVEGPLSSEQTGIIAELLEAYKSRDKTPSIQDYQVLRTSAVVAQDVRRHDSDYYLIDNHTNSHYLIELKIGGDLDNKKARSEKEAILEQFSILSNTLPRDRNIEVFFATAYNRFGESRPWQQQRVRQFFADDELLIGREFWNFVCQDESGYDWVMEAYRLNSFHISTALESIRKTYLG